jgi:galactokinase
VSTPELDLLVRWLQAEDAVFGARLTGAGFGGACVALCRADSLGQVAESVLEKYNGAGHHGRQLVPAA